MRGGRRAAEGGRYIVTGPFVNDTRVISVGAGVSLAQNHATKHRRKEGTLTYYVRDILGVTTYATVTKGADGIILTRPSVAA